MPTFTPVIPSQYQTDRVDVHDAVLAILTAYQAANPGIINQIWHARPAGVGEFPLVFIGRIDEDVLHDSGTRTTIFRGSIIYVDTLSFSPETDERVNYFLDQMRDLFTVNARILSTGILQYAGTGAVSDEELGWGPDTNTTGTRIDWTFQYQRGDQLQFP